MGKIPGNKLSPRVPLSSRSPLAVVYATDLLASPACLRTRWVASTRIVSWRTLFSLSSRSALGEAFAGHRLILPSHAFPEPRVLGRVKAEEECF